MYPPIQVRAPRTKTDHKHRGIAIFYKEKKLKEISQAYNWLWCFQFRDTPIIQLLLVTLKVFVPTNSMPKWTCIHYFPLYPQTSYRNSHPTNARIYNMYYMLSDQRLPSSNTYGELPHLPFGRLIISDNLWNKMQLWTHFMSSSRYDYIVVTLSS